MSDNVTVELTKEQREVLLRGLRFVRSSIMLDVHNPTPESDTERTSQLQSISRLVNQLNGVAPSHSASGVS